MVGFLKANLGGVEGRLRVKQFLINLLQLRRLHGHQLPRAVPGPLRARALQARAHPARRSDFADYGILLEI